MGFFAVRGTGVFDKLRYPYFHVDLQQVGRLVDIASEDVAFCKNLAKVGIPVVVDPELVVGHEKAVVL
jgi:GT2 family glycosyltransferase